MTVLAGDDASQLAAGVSRALYDESPVVVLAGDDDPTGQDEAADRAAELGVPLLLVPMAEGSATEEPPADDPPADDPPADDPPTDSDGDPPLEPLEELARLAAQTVLAYGEAATEWAQQVEGVDVVAGPGEALDLAPPEPLTSLTVLAATGDEHAVAATATARAAGARVLFTDVTDPRTDPEVIAELAGETPTHTLALGSGFGPPEQLRDRLAVAATGVELPGGGQVLFPGRRLVALYGHPRDTVLGALGEQSLDQTIARAQDVAAEYDDLVDEPVVPALEIITTIASASAGPTGDYSRRTPPDQLREWIDAAAEAGMYVVLDLQPGHTDFLTQAQEYEELLLEPHVGLALDPEWRLADDQRHMVNVGSVNATEVNQVVEWLADLTAEHRLPQKLLIVHQFQLRMISDRGDLDTGRDQVAVLIHADGFGTQPQKRATWNALHVDAPPGAWWGWKNFYDEDRPMFTPEQTVAIDPSPVFISYQ